MSRHFIFVEGNIATGKTTLLDYFRSKNPIKASGPLVYLENFDLDVPLLSTFYNAVDQDIKNLSFMGVQNDVIGIHLQTFLAAVETKTADVVLFDRSLFGSLIFVSIAFNNMLITLVEKIMLDSLIRNIIRKMFDICKKNNIILHMIHVEGDPNHLYDRYNRKDPFEQMKVDLMYLVQLNEGYDYLDNIWREFSNESLITIDSTKGSLWAYDDFKHVINKFTFNKFI
jgi:deoxyadenosine/deoxycytidine kinase